MKKEKKTLHEHLVMVKRLFLIGFIIMLVPTFLQNDLWTGILLFLGFGIMLAGALYSAKHFRCPYCESKFDPRRGIPNYCPNCGEKPI